MLFTCPLYSWAEEEASEQIKDIQIIDNPYEFEDYKADEYKVINVSIKDIKERLLKGEPVHFVEKQGGFEKISNSLGGIFLKNIQQVNVKQKVSQDVRQETKIDIHIEIDLPTMQEDYQELKDLLIEENTKHERFLNEIGNSLDEVNINSEKEKLIKPMNKLGSYHPRIVK